MDSWLQRLVVCGHAADVTTFRKAASSSARPSYVTLKPELRAQKLSFTKLLAALPEKLADTISEPQEPWDLGVDGPELMADGTTEFAYRFQLDDFTCEDLIVAVSTMYPRLCFVLGTVAPNVDEHSSLMAHSGKVWRWNLSNRLHGIITAKIPEETEENEDDVFWALTQADWEMMDAVVDHWKKKVAKIFSEIGSEKKILPKRRKLATASKT
jgi:hypothetical protein